jgi:hypothetical protein
MESDAEIRRALITKLDRHGYYGGRHTSKEAACKRGFPPHLQQRAKNILEELIKEGIIVQHPTSYGMQIALNPKMRPDIERIIQPQRRNSSNL